jgi:hypothetical protein
MLTWEFVPTCGDDSFLKKKSYGNKQMPHTHAQLHFQP